MAKRKKVRKFLGRIIPSVQDFQSAVSDVIGPHHVLYPKSKADVATAIALCKEHTTFVRSGIQVAKQDLVNGLGGIVINLRELAKVTVKGDEVKAEAGATGEEVAAHLAKSALALPLAANPLKSIASNVLQDAPSHLMRSLGSLSDYVSKISAVKPDGKKVTLKPHKDGTSCIAQCLAARAVITEVAFKAAPAEGLWIFRVTTLYPGQERYLTIARALFVETKFSKTLERTDLVLDTFNGPHDIPLVTITALGSSTKGKNKLKKLVREALACVRDDFAPEDIVEEACSGPEVLSVVAEIGFGAALDPAVDSERHHSNVVGREDFDHFLVGHAKEVHRGIAFGDEGEEKLNPDLRLSSSLQVNRDNGLELSGFFFTPSMDDVSAAPSRSTPLHAGAAAPLPTALTVAKGPIPNFRGEVFRRNDPGYFVGRQQYATSSYPLNRMKPYMVTYPRDAKDIKAAIKFAKANNKSIVARSGGHQYSGKSSGGQDTIVLRMDAFNQIKFAGNMADVGPAVLLTKISNFLKAARMTLPFGECPRVAIGGHSQTGGYGHLVRSFGLILDRVREFDIVLANGTERTITRPPLGTSPSTPDDEIFWGVLGGNAGSFGIVTNYKFDCIRDSKHPNSYGYSMMRRYKKDAFLKLMKQVQKWTKEVANGTLARGIDFMMTVESARLWYFPIPALIVEVVDANLGGPNQPVNGDQRFSSIIKAARSHLFFLEPRVTKKGPKSLSALADSFVRRPPMTTDRGREFKYPYKKRINCTMEALSDDFVRKFVDMVEKVVHDVSGVKLVFQMLMGGGAYQKSNRRAATSVPHRDYVFCFIFDLFYEEGHKGDAEQLQREMQQLVDTDYSPNQEMRVFWGTFGNVDISDPVIRSKYYDTESDYIRLQALKARLDPDDVFHTELTVQLP